MASEEISSSDRVSDRSSEFNSEESLETSEIDAIGESSITSSGKFRSDVELFHQGYQWEESSVPTVQQGVRVPRNNK